MAPEGIVRLEGVEEVCCGAASWVRLSWVRLQDLETHYRESPGAGLGCRERLGAGCLQRAEGLGTLVNGTFWDGHLSLCLSCGFG